DSVVGGAGRSGGGRRAQRGTSLGIKAKLTLEATANGVEEKVKGNRQVQWHTWSGTGAKDKSSHQTSKTCGGAGSVRPVTNTILEQMQTTSTCPTCNGEGVEITSKCTACRGEGLERGEETIAINIPAGVSEGMQ